MKKTWVGASLVLTAVVLEDPLGRPTSYISLLHRLDVLPVTQPTRVLKGTQALSTDLLSLSANGIEKV